MLRSPRKHSLAYLTEQGVVTGNLFHAKPPFLGPLSFPQRPPVFPEHSGCCWAPKGLTDHNLIPLSPASNQAFPGSESQISLLPWFLPSLASETHRPQILQAVRRQLWNQQDLCSRALHKSLRLLFLSLREDEWRKTKTRWQWLRLFLILPVQRNHQWRLEELCSLHKGTCSEKHQAGRDSSIWD